MRTEDEITQAIEKALAKHRANEARWSHAQRNKSRQTIRDLRAELAAVLTEGAKPCPNCGEHPHGIHQPWGYVVGCLSLTCSGRHSRGNSIALAIENWNAEAYYRRR